MSSHRSKTLVIDAAKGVGLVAVLLALLAGFGWFVWADSVSQSAIVRLPGASKAEVRELLGEPDLVDDEFGRWFYRRPLRVAEFRVDFDEAGRAERWSYGR